MDAIEREISQLTAVDVRRGSGPGRIEESSVDWAYCEEECDECESECQSRVHDRGAVLHVLCQPSIDEIRFT